MRISDWSSDVCSSDLITPPVSLAAYAAAGMAGADPFKTGNTAFRLGLGKILVPFVFVFSPSLLLVTADFTWSNFFIAFIGCTLGITCHGAALSIGRASCRDRVC